MSLTLSLITPGLLLLSYLIAITVSVLPVSKIRITIMTIGVLANLLSTKDNNITIILKGMA